jgi:lipopolysaccharide biosynthesis glycosyltransferase
MLPDVEIHVPISPTESFFQQVHYLAVSLRHRGGKLRDSPIIVTVGEDCEPFDIGRKLSWPRHYPIEFRWLPRRLYQQHIYYATIAQRYGYRFQAPYVLQLDADMVVARNLDDLLDRVVSEPAVYAVLAYYSPWWNSKLLHIRSDEEWWRRAFETAGLGEPPFTCEYAGYGATFTGDVRHCPPYFNQGLVLAPAPIMAAVGNVLYREMEAANRTVETFYRVQVALAFAISRQQLPWRAIPLRYNLPTLFASVLAKEWDDARVLHYSGTHWFEKDRLMTVPGAMEEWLSELSQDPVETYFRELFRGLHAEVMQGKPDASGSA